jgi:hypothetical protein
MKHLKIIEAYIDDTGNLQDFEMSPEDLSFLELQDSLDSLKASFVEKGAQGIDVFYNDDAGSVHISYAYLGISFYVRFKLDSNLAVAYYDWGASNDVVFKGSIDELAEQIATRGLDSLLS